MKNYIKFIPYGVIIILAIILFSYVPTIQRGQKLDKLTSLSNVWNDCEKQQLEAQNEAKQLRQEFGLTQASQPQAVVRTGTQVQQLTGYIIE